MLKVETLKQRETSLDLILYTILFLFFSQLLTEFFEATYAFGLLGTGIPVEAVSVVVLFAPLLLLFSRRGISPMVLLILGEVIVFSRALEVMLDTRGRMLVSGLGVGAFLLFLPAFLTCQRREQDGQESFRLSIGLSLAVLSAILLRVLNSGSDLTLVSDFRILGWFLALVGGAILVARLNPAYLTTTVAIQEGNQAGKSSRILALSLGLFGVFVLLYFAFTSPNVIARWTGGNYPSIVAFLAGSWGLMILAISFKPDLLFLISPLSLLVANLTFTLGLSLTILIHQLRFPADPALYPFGAPEFGIWGYVPLVVMLILSPVLGVDFFFFVRGLLRERPSLPRLGLTFGLGSLLLLLLVLAHVFTTVYDYIPLVGAFFRDRFWVVYLAATILIFFPLQYIHHLFKNPPDSLYQCQTTPVIVVVGVLWFGAVLGSIFPQIQPASPSSENGLRLLTYNVQQGYDQDGQRNYDGQIALIREINPDVVGLQESDTNRIAGGNADLVRYFADHLGMVSYYGPKTVTGTFGVALLSRYPILNPRTFFMYSQGEQTAAIEADIRVGDKTFHILVTHLGNDGPIVQQEGVLRELEWERNVIAMGDFNFRPDSEQYRLTLETLADAWVLGGQDGGEATGFDPSRRIDHIFVTPGMQVLRSWYDLSPQSDHPALAADISW